jgi:uncharacterized membrane protein YoaK (UPF0700 family)
MTPRQQIESYLGLYKNKQIKQNPLKAWKRTLYPWALFTLGAVWGALVAGALSTLL